MRACASIARAVWVVFATFFLPLLCAWALPCRVFGPQSLKSIAAAVLQCSLTQRLDSLEAAETTRAPQEPGPSTSSASCCIASAQGCKSRCSVVSVQACSSEDSDAGASQTLPQTRTGSADVNLVVVHTDLSAGTTPAGSRATSPDGGCTTCPTATMSGSCGSAFAVPSCAAPAGSDRPRTVTFSTGDRQGSDESVADAAACCAEGAGALRHALTTASSSGWYDELCCVCWESEVTAVMEPCMHAMCLACARQLVGCSGTAGPTCPLCRAFIAGFGQVPHNVRQQAGKRKKCLMAGAGI
jgi:hypothetical protein